MGSGDASYQWSLCESSVLLPAPAAIAVDPHCLWCCRFFCMSFINTILDSLANSLVITAPGGGTERTSCRVCCSCPAVYGVLPCSLLFLVAYSWATQRLSRQILFNIIISSFLLLYSAFALLYPSHESLHFHMMADQALTTLPIGLAGLVGMVRNWMFTMFYCVSELWGDIVLSLLFWGLANDTTTLRDAPLLYPLFGVGANVAQTLAGRMLSVAQQAPTIAAAAADAARISSGAAASPSGQELEYQPRQQQPPDSRRGQGRRRPSMSLKQAVVFLVKSPQIRCLALMALAQGLSTNLLDIAWKTHLHMLHPSPGAYAAFMGEVAMWTGIVTGTFMFASPILFERLGWQGVASVTPRFMLWAGMPFFAGISLYALWPAHSGLGAVATLRILVLGGAMLQIFARGAKFAMYKPAEEMVYIGLDEESRTKGKAAIDVVGAQTGKSIGSVLQQVVLLLLSGGSRAGSLPIMAVAFFAMLRSWIGVPALTARQHVSCRRSSAADGCTSNRSLQQLQALSSLSQPMAISA
eukprot:jgi/Astpho2/2727/e_gw1.00050.92.1_t